MIRISQRPFRGAFFAPASGKRPWAPPGACSGRVPKPQIRKRASPRAGTREHGVCAYTPGGAHVPAPGPEPCGAADPAAVPQARVRPGCPVYGAAPFLPGPASRLPPQNGGHPFLRHAGALPAYLSRFTQIADKSIPVVCSAYPWCPVAFPGGGFTRGRGSAQRFSRR